MLFEDNMVFMITKILVSFAGTIAMMCSTTDLRYVKRKPVNIVIWIGYAVYSILSSYAIIHFFGYESFLRIFIITISFPIIFFLHNVSDESFPQIIFIRATHILVSLYIAASVTLINTALNGTELSDILLRLLAYIIVVLLDYRFFRKVYLNFVCTIQRGWGILSLIPSSFIILAVTIAFYPEHYTKRTASIVLIYLLGIVIVIVYFAICAYLYLQYNQTASEQNREILEVQVQNIREKAARVKELEEETKIIRHDMRHILTTITSLAENGNPQAILDYIYTIAAPCDASLPKHYCSDAILDATLSSYLGQAKAMGISVETSLSIPDTLPIDSAELSICFANALINAIKANEKLPGNERIIILRCIHKPKLMFEIMNPYKEKITFDKNNIPVSSEIDLKISTQSIIAFCHRHDAFYSFKAEKGWFKVIVKV